MKQSKTKQNKIQIQKQTDKKTSKKSSYFLKRIGIRL